MTDLVAVNSQLNSIASYSIMLINTFSLRMPDKFGASPDFFNQMMSELTC